MTLTWLDKPFFDLIIQINSLLPYFMKLARYIAGIALLLNIGIAALKYAINHSGFKDDVVKTVTACLLFYIIMSAYPAIITGLNTLVYNISMNTLYTSQVKDMIDKTRGNTEFWAKKQDKKSGEYSDIIALTKSESNSNIENVGQHYILDLYLEGTGYFSPNSVIRVLMLIMESIHYRASLLPRMGPTSIPKDLGTWILLMITSFLVLFAGIFAASQYFIGAIEFCLIAAIGIILLPGMLWNGSKFLTEKFIGAIFGQFIKLLFVSICLMLMCTGFLSLATRPFTGALDQVVYTCFAAIIYMMLCQSGPQLAVSLLTGTPQMSLMEAAKGAGTLAAGAAGAAGVAGAAGQTVLKGGGVLSKAAGAGISSFKNNFEGPNRSVGVAGAAALYGAGKSVLGSAGQAIQSGAHNLTRSVMGGKQQGGGSSFNRSGSGTNRYSLGDKYNTPNENGTRKTMPEFYKEMFNEGKSNGIGKLGKESATTKTSNPTSSTEVLARQNIGSSNVPMISQGSTLVPRGKTPWYGYAPALPPSALPQSSQASQYLPPPTLPVPAKPKE